MNTKKILIIEDDKALCTVLKTKLEQKGCSVELAHDGKEGLHKVDSDHFDIILLDLLMPQMDGFTFLSELKNKKITTPVIVTTNLSQDEDRSKALALGAKDFFIKADISLDDIQKRMLEVMHCD
jgi:DNA-binding response OmpR family regulator